MLFLPTRKRERIGQKKLLDKNGKIFSHFKVKTKKKKKNGWNQWHTSEHLTNSL